MLIYKIKLAKETDPQAFVAFMDKDYIPAVHKGATRIGQVTDLVLLQGPATHEFFWHVGWSGLSSGGVHVDDEKVQRKFDSLVGKLQPLGSYQEVAAWHM